jgi:ribosomal-protein-alanine N-acetyltransferase
MKHLGTRRLETNRLELRRFELSDSEAMFKNWASDSEVTHFLMWPTHDDPGVSEAVLKDWVPRYREDSYYHWAITLRSNGNEPIGSIAVMRIDESIGMVHVGYAIGRKWWNQGITSEALAALIRFLFKEVMVNRIESRHDPRNPHSGKVMEKCGLIYEGTIKQGDWNNQGICDCCMYGLVAEDYKG